MESALQFAVTIIGVVVLWAVLRVVIYRMATQNNLFTFRTQDQFTYHMRGKILHEIVYKLTNHRVDQETGEVIKSPGAGNEQETWSERILGARWIGISPNTMLRFMIRYDREQRNGDIERQQEGKESGIEVEKDYRIVHRYTSTTFQFWKQVYPVVVADIELADGTKVDIYGTMTVQTFNARKSVITLGGNWFGHVRDAVEGAITDWAKKMDIKDFTKKNKAGNMSSLEKVILATKETNPALLKKGKSDSGTIETTGTGVVAFNFSKWNLVEKDPDLAKAYRAEALAKLEAAATRAKASGEADAIKAIGNANADAARQLGEAIGSNPGGIPVLVAQQLSEGMKQHEGALVIGGNPNTILPLDSQPKQEPKKTT